MYQVFDLRFIVFGKESSSDDYGNNEEQYLMSIVGTCDESVKYYDIITGQVDQGTQSTFLR